jgi:IS5 family transposase
MYRRFNKLWTFEYAGQILRQLESDNNYKGYGLLRLFKCLLLQFMEDVSDRELERFISENLAAKWFCGFGISEATPHFTLFGKLRKKIGTNNLSDVFADLRVQLKSHGVMSEVFTFVDATHLISKANLWEERDKAIEAKYEKLNNETLPKVAHDTQARIGAKAKVNSGMVTNSIRQ